ncbi:MAG: FapA family protein, partial [Treponema sp.]|nr:FapA family protein [Treponema sp.]
METEEEPSPYSAQNSDGRIFLTFYNNNLEARGDFFPPMEGGIPITGGYINELLDANRIVFGIQHDEIHKAYETCVINNEIVRDVLMAKGDPPIDEVPQYMQMNPYLGQKTEQEKTEGAVDHRSRSPFIIVKKGQALAK